MGFWKSISFKVKTVALVVLLIAFTALTAIRYHLLVKRITATGITQTTDVMLTGYKSELKDMVDMTAQVLASATEGLTDENQIHDIFKRLVDKARFFQDQSGYIFIYKKGGTVFVLPPEPDLEGKNLIGLKDATGKLLINELDTKARLGGGFVRYLWPKPPKKEIEPKLSYARMIPGNSYWIGAGVYIDNIQTKKQAILSAEHQMTDAFLRSLYIVLGTGLVVVVLPLTFLLIRNIVTPVRELTTVADRFSRGQMDLVIPYTDRGDEIGRMAKALNRLGMSIKMAAARLKQ